MRPLIKDEYAWEKNWKSEDFRINVSFLVGGVEAFSV